MQCPSCQNTDSRVLESRSADTGKSVRRRRECLNCDFRFTTYERVESSPITVLKNNGSKELFNRSKVFIGLDKACEKTEMGKEKIDLIIDEVELKLQQNFPKEVKSSDIAELLLEQLKKTNEVAYIRFASVHKKFHGINDFIATLETIKKQKAREFASVS